MFFNNKIIEVFGPAMVLSSLLLVFFRRRIKKKGESLLSQAISDFKLTSIVFGGLVLLLWFLLIPSTLTGSLPDDASLLSNPKQSWALLQYNGNLQHRTAQVVMWFLFLFVFWFLPALYKVVKAVVDQNAAPTSAQGS